MHWNAIALLINLMYDLPMYVVCGASYIYFSNVWQTQILLVWCEWGTFSSTLRAVLQAGRAFYHVTLSHLFRACAPNFCDDVPSIYAINQYKPCRCFLPVLPDSCSLENECTCLPLCRPSRLSISTYSSLVLICFIECFSFFICWYIVICIIFIAEPVTKGHFVPTNLTEIKFERHTKYQSFFCYLTNNWTYTDAKNEKNVI